jgi:DNA-binding Lrp family transcriptional regulator
MKAYVLIKVRSGEVNAVVKELRKTDKVVEADMTFGPYDAVAVIESPDVSSLGSLIASSIQPIPGVEQTLTCIAVDI